MSVKVSAWVWDHSQAKATDRLVLLAIADHASHEGTDAYPSQPTIAQMCKVSRATVIRSIAHLIAMGELAAEHGEGAARGSTRQKTNRYSFPAYRVWAGYAPAPKTLQSETPSPREKTLQSETPSGRRRCNDDTKDVALVQHKPSFNPSLKTSSSSAPDGAAGEVGDDLFGTSKSAPQVKSGRRRKPDDPAGLEQARNARDVVKAWHDAYTAATPTKPPQTRCAQVGKEAKALIEAGNPVDVVIRAAEIAGGQGRWSIEYQLTSAARNGHGARSDAQDMRAANAMRRAAMNVDGDF